MKIIDPVVLEKARKWMNEGFDEETRASVQNMIDHDTAGLTESFYRDLEFGTGGLRGIMGVGTNRMNRYTVGMATQGFANYLKQFFTDEDQISVAIAYDCRHNSPYFANVTAEILSANGIKVFLFHSLRPTPMLSFTVRHFQCQGGIMITASHNPKEYNGYKVYWDDGGQLVPPHDHNVIAEVQKVNDPGKIMFGRNDDLIELVGEDFDDLYIDTLKSLSLSPALINKYSDLKLVFTPIHGAAVRLVPLALKAFGFTNVINVPEQDVVDGDFPTVVSPNPEESAALQMAIIKAEETAAELVMATDPDGDRVGIAVRDPLGKFVLLNGNQAASLMIYYILEQWKQKRRFTGKEFLAKTIVTTELLDKMADYYGVACFDVLTGFKYIAELIRILEGEKTFIAGGEESYGYLVGDFVRDKDAVISCCMLAETSVWAKDQGKTMYELLMDIYVKFGLYHERLLSITKKGKAGLEEIKDIMQRFRTAPPESIAGIRVSKMLDYKQAVAISLDSKQEEDLDFPLSDVLQFILEDGTKITMRPSGTEPKIKFYFGTHGKLTEQEAYLMVRDDLDQKIDRIIEDLQVSAY
jgi:phosphoglucomutase